MLAPARAFRESAEGLEDTQLVRSRHARAMVDDADLEEAAGA
jgi:hypothetical protein